MLLNIFFFVASLLADILAYIFYQRYVDSHRKDAAFLVYAVVTAALVWIFIFKLQDRGQILRVFVPVWAAGSAVFGYIAAGLATKTPLRELLNPQAIACIVAITLGIYFLNRLTFH
jgi:drug/metabolite transporter (DMT)-like permease